MQVLRCNLFRAFFLPIFHPILLYNFEDTFMASKYITMPQKFIFKTFFRSNVRFELVKNVLELKSRVFLPEKWPKMAVSEIGRMTGYAYRFQNGPIIFLFYIGPF